MNQIIHRTEMISCDYFASFGFERDQVDATVSKGLNELENSFEELRKSAEGAYDFDSVDRALHTIKGLLFQLGNEEDGERVETLRREISAGNYREKISELLHS